MNIRYFASALILASASAACGSAGDSTASSNAADTTSADAGAAAFAWPLPAHWAHETIPFPLSFAPELPYTGSLELRFMPEFFTTTADSYFSYNYAWMLDAPPAVTAEQLGHDLTVYYAGLARDSDPAHFDATAHHAQLTTVDATHFRGTIDTQDGFNASVPVHLQVDVQVSPCGDRPVLLFSLSPHAFDDAMWTTLLAQRATFQCTLPAHAEVGGG